MKRWMVRQMDRQKTEIHGQADIIRNHFSTMMEIVKNQTKIALIKLYNA